jgi:hypothetical protein
LQLIVKLLATAVLYCDVITSALYMPLARRKALNSFTALSLDLADILRVRAVGFSLVDMRRNG